ncbi:MAG: TonB-dependent receptor domain-containing protein [Alcaligenes sp.]
MKAPFLTHRLNQTTTATALALLSVSVSAQNAEPAVTQLDTVVVTATGTALDVKDAPASISVITAEEIKKIPAADLNEVLRRVPGLSQATTPDGGTSIQIRGLPQSYTLILVDGRRVGSSNDTFDRYSRNEVNWIPPESIERIEVIRGPMSSLYGSDAMGGVINIITKKTEDKWGGSFRVGGEINEDSIRGNDYFGGFTIGGGLGKGFRLRLNGEQTYQQADHELPSGTTAFRFGGGREGSKLKSFGARLDWEINEDHDLSLNYLNSRRNTVVGPNPAGSNPLASTATRGPRQMDREELSLSHTGYYSFGTSKLSVTRTKYENATTAPVIANNQLTGATYPTEAVAKDLVIDGSLSMPFTLGLEQTLTVGAQWQRNELDNANSVGSVANAEGVVGLSYNKVHNRALFMEDQLQLLDNLTLTMGARWDDNSNFGSQVSPRAYLVWHPSDEWTLRGGYSEGFKAPSLRQGNPNFVGQSQGAGCTGGFSPCSTRGNADLKPETTKSIEIGAGWERDGWEFGVTAFNTDFKNKLQTGYLGQINGQHFYQYYNAQEAVSRGIEANFTIPLSDRLTWSTSATHMFKAEEKDTGAPLSVVPEWAFTSMLDIEINSVLNASVQAQYIGKQVNLDWRVANQSGSSGSQRIQNAYTIFDVGFNYQPTKSLKFDLGVKNLFDKNPNGTSPEGNNFYTPGRRYFATMTASF